MRRFLVGVVLAARRKRDRRGQGDSGYGAVPLELHVGFPFQTAPEVPAAPGPASNPAFAAQSFRSQAPLATAPLRNASRSGVLRVRKPKGHHGPTTDVALH